MPKSITFIAEHQFLNSGNSSRQFRKFDLLKLQIMRILLLSILCAFTGCLPKNIMIYQNPGIGYGPCEPSIFINPAKPDNIVAGAIINTYHYSFDGGKSWTTDHLSSSHGVYGDPCITADQKGRFYYLHLANPLNSGNLNGPRILESIVVQRSDDGGKSWNDGAAIGLNPPKQQDKEWAVVNPANNDIYVTWTQFDVYGSADPDCYSQILFSKSSDLAESWSKPIQLNEISGDCIDDDNTVEGAVPSVGPNGEIYVAWSYQDKIYFDRSTDGGASWLDQDIVVASQPGGWNIDVQGVGRANAMPVTGVDLSGGPHHGTIYVSWGDARNGADNIDIFLAYSKDGGNSWSEPVQVNRDATHSQQFFPWMAVDPITGRIYIVYYDRSQYDDLRTDVVVAASKDGGKHFKNMRISEKPFIPPGDTDFFGDYNNISAYDGKVRPIWTHYENGKLSIWTALINL